MTSFTTKPDSSQPAAETAVHLFDNWFDPIEAGLRDRAREFSKPCSKASSTRCCRARTTLAVRSRRATMRVEPAPPVIATATGRGRYWKLRIVDVRPSGPDMVVVGPDGRVFATRDEASRAMTTIVCKSQ